MALNPKQQRFVAEYLTDLNATQAAIRAGYSPRTAKQIGHENLTKPDIASAIAEGQAKLSGALEITAETVLRNLEAARAKAMAEAQCGAAIRACELQGKHIGMFVERTQSDVTIHDAIDRPPQETREQWLARREKELTGGALGTTAGTAD